VNARRLLHQVLAHQIVAARFEHCDHGLSDCVTVNVQIVGDTAHDLIAGLEADRPRIMRGIVPLVGASGDKQLCAECDLSIIGARPVLASRRRQSRQARPAADNTVMILVLIPMTFSF
jgi:hypothetical protein